MKITSVTGVIETLGEARKPEPELKTYDYISIRDKDGQDIIAKKVRVWNDVDRLLSPGASGTFIFAKVFLHNELHAVRIGDREAYSSWIQGGMGKVYFGLVLILLFGLGLSALIIGIPFVVLALWGMIMMPMWKASIVNTARAEGFKLSKARRI